METPRYRIGNDLTVFWAINNRDGSPFDLAGKGVRLFVTNERGREEVEVMLTKLDDQTINNVIRWDFKGEKQRVLGLHKLTVEISESDSHREITRDYCEAFTFVSRSDMETEEGDANITIGGDLILSSKLDIYRFEAVDVDVSEIKQNVHRLDQQVAVVNTAVAEQKVKVDDLYAEVSTKASTESVTIVDGRVTTTQEAVAQQKIRVDGLEASIENLVGYEEFNALTGEVDSKFTQVNQTAEGIQTTIREQSGEIADIKESVSGISVSVGNIGEGLASVSGYFEDILSDNTLTPIEKDQLFEIYRNLAKEYDANVGNAFNYKIWKYAADGKTETSGLNGAEGRFEKYQAYKDAYSPIVAIFNSKAWGFDKMDETTEISEGTISGLKAKLDTYYAARGELSKVFSSITASIEDAQKAAEEVLAKLTDVLSPEEMNTLIGKGVVLSTVIATKDAKGNITAAMNASQAFKDNSGFNYGRIIFAGGVNDIDDWNDANFVVYENGHVRLNSVEARGLATEKDLFEIKDVTTGLAGLLGEMFSVTLDANGKVIGVTALHDFNVKKNLTAEGEISAGGAGEEGDVLASGTVTGIVVDNGEVISPDANGTVDLSDVLKDVVDGIDLTGFATENWVSEEIAKDSKNKVSRPEFENAVNGINAVTDGHTAQLAAIGSDIEGLKSKDEEHAVLISNIDGRVTGAEKDIDQLESNDQVHDSKITEIESTLGIINEWYENVGSKFECDGDTINTDLNFSSSKEISAGGAGEESDILASGTVTGIRVGDGLYEPDANGTVGLPDYATKSDVDARVSAIVDGAPENYDTLREIADVLEGNEGSIGDLINMIGNKASNDDLAAIDSKYADKVSELSQKDASLESAVGDIEKRVKANEDNIVDINEKDADQDIDIKDIKDSLGPIEEWFDKVASHLNVSGGTLHTDLNFSTTKEISAGGAGTDTGEEGGGSGTLDGLLDVTITDFSGLSSFEKQSQVLGYDADNGVWKNRKTMYRYNHPSSDRWEISHGLNKMPNVKIIDSTGALVHGTVIYGDGNGNDLLSKVVITFGGKFAGTAFLD